MAVTKTSNIDILLKEREREHLANVQRKRKAFWMTTGIYALLLLGIFFINIPPKDPPYPVDDSGAVGVLLGTGEEGSGMELGSVMAGNPGQNNGQSQPQPSENMPPMTAASDPQPQETGSETGDDPESVAIQNQRTQKTQNQDKSRPDPNANRTTTTTQRQEQPKPAETFNSNLGFESSTNGSNGANGPGGDKQSSGTGTNGPGSPGYKDGVPNGGGGLNANGPAALGNRRVEYTPAAPSINYNRKGTVIVTIIVDRSGNVIETLGAPARGSTITDPKVVDQVRVWAKKFKFSASSNGLDREQGTVTYVFSY